ncbi:MAG: CbtB-domain containing protein [Alphaproteobacteria bacterium]|nr:CbtB-domain containing protein [Alphaproteobacteria bacterium]
MGATGIIVHTPARVASQQAAVWAILLGLMLIWGVGFATPSALHNAAHDSRHGLAFPCH